MNPRYLLLLLVVCLLIGSVQAWGADMGAWDYRKEITVNNTGAELTNYQLKFTINRDTGVDSGFIVYVDDKCEEDYDDIRFTTGENTLCDYWIESSSSSTATVWVEVPTIAAGDTTMYLYYHNSGASAVSNGDNTFPFFDDFPGTSLNTTKWDNIAGSGVSVGSGIVTITASSAAIYGIVSDNNMGTNISIRAYVKPYHFGDVTTYLEGLYARFIDDTHQITAYYSHVSAVGGKYYQVTGGTTDQQDITGGSSNWLISEGKLGTASTIWTLNDANTKTQSNYYPTSSGKVRIITYASNSKIDCDWFFVRKYTATEPTISAWGSEEEQYPKYLTVDFSGVPTSGYVPLTIYFTDASVGYNVTLDTWAWSFGDTSPNSTQQNPAHTYTTLGLYNVILTVTNTSFSKTNTTAKTAYINATVNLDAPNADFTTVETCGNVGDTFYFIDFSSGGGLYSWVWDFGDGSCSEMRNPTHQYYSNGEYDISLTVSGVGGTDTITKEDYITIPCSVITPTPTTPTPTPTTTTTYVSYGNITAYDIGIDYIIWKISDMNTTHVYADGKLVNLSGVYYGQHGLSPDTPHTVCLNNGECLTVSTHIDGISVFWYWSVFILLIILVIISYRIPVTYAPTVLYGIYLVLVLLPNRGAGFEEYLLTGILLIFGIIAASRGMTK